MQMKFEEPQKVSEQLQDHYITLPDLEALFTKWVEKAPVMELEDGFEVHKTESFNEQ